MALVTDDGIEEHDGDTDWEDTALCVCGRCNEDTQVRHFKDNPERRVIDMAFNTVSLEDSDLITAIAIKARELFELNALTLSIDLTLVHYRTPLDLQRLLDATASDFSHDAHWISREIDRETGDLGFFVPRYVKG